MDNFQIETAQNIGITQEIAGIGERILAYLIDSLIMLSYLILVVFLLSGLEVEGRNEWVLSLILGLPLFLYFLLWEIFWNGRTPGKAAMELRVVRLDGTNPTLGNYLVRWLLRLVDITLTSGSVAVLTILWNGKGQRLGDLAAGTTVISEKEKFSAQSLFSPVLPENYQPQYPQVTLLSDSDVQKIRELYNEALKKGDKRVMSLLSEKISQMLEVSPATKPSDFIQTVLRDYSYYTQK